MAGRQKIDWAENETRAYYAFIIIIEKKIMVWIYVSMFEQQIGRQVNSSCVLITYQNAIIKLTVFIFIKIFRFKVKRKNFLLKQNYLKLNFIEMLINSNLLAFILYIF